MKYKDQMSQFINFTWNWFDPETLIRAMNMKMTKKIEKKVKQAVESFYILWVILLSEIQWAIQIVAYELDIAHTHTQIGLFILWNFLFLCLPLMWWQAYQMLGI